MSLVKTWYTPEDAESKFGVEKSLILKWVEEGLVRCEREDGVVTRVNIDDVRLEVESLVRRSHRGGN
jgi:predicted site-specific integrase-resolvase